MNKPKEIEVLNYRMRDLTGKRFGRLFVLGLSNKKHRRAKLWKCQCDCGNITYVLGYSLKSEATKSCGCLRNEKAEENFNRNGGKPKHGDAKIGNKTRLYCIWCGMRNRCYNKNNKDYQYYGAKGIKLCREWKENYSVFKKWALANGYNDELVIDRIHSDENYNPSNCHWMLANDHNLKTVKEYWAKRKLGITVKPEETGGEG